MKLITITESILTMKMLTRAIFVTGGDKCEYSGFSGKI